MNKSKTFLIYLLFIFLLPSLVFGQQREVKGTVRDVSTKELLPGVTVSIEGSAGGVITDIDGNYSIKVNSDNEQLRFSYIGYTPEIILVGTQSQIDVNLIQDIKQLDEIVVIGYGVSKKSDLTGALTSVSSSDYEKEPVVNMSQVLKGRTTGVSVTETSGAPGSSAKIRIRGMNSINSSNDPLYIVDGVSADPSTVNVNDIESIEILKDASATAIYGNRGANGVVLISTKKGKEGKSQVSFEYFRTFDQIPDNRLIQTVDAADFMRLFNANKGYEQFTQSEIDSVRSLGPGTNWQKEVFRPGLKNNYQLSLSHGSKKTQYYVSANFMDQQGVVITSSYKKYSLRSNITHQVFDQLSVGVNTNIYQDSRHNTSFEDRLFEAQVWSPNVPVDADEDILGRGPTGVNPVKSIESVTDDDKSLKIGGTFNVNWEIIKGLTFNPILGINYRSGNRKKFEAPFKEGMFAELELNDKESSNIQNSNILTYYKEIGNSSITLTGVNEWIKNYNYNYNVSEEQINDPRFGYYVLGLGAVQNLPEADYSESALLSYLGRANYSYAQKYLITGSIRADGYSRFAEGKKWGYFPSVALAWKISEESFLKEIEILRLLKLRGSYGIVGNADIDPYTTMGVLSLVKGSTPYGYPYASYNDYYRGYGLGDPQNSNLRWEETEQKNIGFDISLWKDKLRVSFDYYDKNTNDLLLKKPLPAYIGGGNAEKTSSFVWANAGQINNKGYDIIVDYNPIATTGFSWDITFNASHFSNKVVELNNIEIPVNSTWNVSTHRIVEGKPINSFYLYDHIGVWSLEDSVQAAVYSAKPGDAKYLDANNDSTINNNDVVYCGNANPDFVWGLNQTFTFKNLFLNVLVTGSHGGKTFNYNYLNTMSSTLFSVAAVHEDALNYYDPIERPNSDVPVNIATEYDNSSRFLQDVSYVKIKNITLGYNLPKSLVKGLNLTITVGAQNLFTFTKYKGYDPELTSGSNSNDSNSGVDMSTYPIPRSYSLGIKATF